MIKGSVWLYGDHVNTDLIIPGRYLDDYDLRSLSEHAMEDVDLAFSRNVRTGDIIVAGRNFGMGPKMNGYIAMQALGLGLVCESMPFLAYRAAIGVGLRVLTDCPSVTTICGAGDELEVDFESGHFANVSRGVSREFPPLPDALREIVELGGNSGWLKRWWENRETPMNADGRQ